MTQLVPAVTAALAATAKPSEDEGARALAMRYAELMDAAAPERGYAKAIRLVDEAVQDKAAHLPLTSGQQLLDAWDKISAALSEHSTASDLGPKLLAALTAVGATLAGRKTDPGKGGEVKDMPRPLAAVRSQPAPWAPHRAG